MAEITSFTWEMHRARRSSPVLSTVGPAEWTFQQSPDPSRSPGHTSTHVQILLNKVYLIVYSLIQGPELRILYVLCVTLESSRILKRENDESSDVWFTWGDVELRAWPISPHVLFPSRISSLFNYLSPPLYLYFPLFFLCFLRVGSWAISPVQQKVATGFPHGFVGIMSCISQWESSI